MTPILLLISAPSGAGKTTVCNQLLAAAPNLSRVVTCTTRPPRPGEREGIDYRFLSQDDFARRVEAGEFLEHATVYGQRYGTLRSLVLDTLAQGRDVLLNIDVQGAATVRNRAREHPTLANALVTVFLVTPSLAVLEQRLRGRKQDDESTLRRRLNAARDEVARWTEFDYLVVSGSIPEDACRMLAILETERLRTTRTTPPPFD
jgi:guanylate kinase